MAAAPCMPGGFGCARVIWIRVQQSTRVPATMPSGLRRYPLRNGSGCSSWDVRVNERSSRRTNGYLTVEVSAFSLENRFSLYLLLPVGDGRPESSAHKVRHRRPEFLLGTTAIDDSDACAQNGRQYRASSDRLRRRYNHHHVAG